MKTFKIEARVIYTVTADSAEEAMSKIETGSLDINDNEKVDQLISYKEVPKKKPKKKKVKKKKFSEYTVTFKHKGKQHTLTFTPEEEDWWESQRSNGVMFDYHYCEEYNDICVYEYDEKSEQKLEPAVYTRKINKK